MNLTEQLNTPMIKLDESPTQAQIESLERHGFNTNDLGFYSNGNISITVGENRSTMDIHGKFII